jgi:hypothetical protein
VHEVCAACGAADRLARYQGVLTEGWFATWELGRAETARRYRKSVRVTAAVIGAVVVAIAAALAP